MGVRARSSTDRTAAESRTEIGCPPSLSNVGSLRMTRPPRANAPGWTTSPIVRGNARSSISPEGQQPLHVGRPQYDRSPSTLIAVATPCTVRRPQKAIHRACRVDIRFDSRALTHPGSGSPWCRNASTRCPAPTRRSLAVDCPRDASPPLQNDLAPSLSELRAR
jgi:hypothetical protein